MPVWVVYISIKYIILKSFNNGAQGSQIWKISKTLVNISIQN